MLRVGQRHQPSFRSSGSCSRQLRADLGMKYVPDGLSPEQWKKMQKEEAEKKKKMGDLGQVKGEDGQVVLSSCTVVQHYCCSTLQFSIFILSSRRETIKPNTVSCSLSSLQSQQFISSC